MSSSAIQKSSELNNNNSGNNDDVENGPLLLVDDYRRQKSNGNNFAAIPSSSSSSCSEISLDNDLQDEKSNNLKICNNNSANEIRDYLRCRSKSDGGESLQPPSEPFEVFPSLPLDILEKMDLIGMEPKDRISEEEIEQKFISLALAFKTDATTIQNRCERQRHYRDQTENNLVVEIEKLIEKLTHIQPLCVNVQTTELLTTLLEQADVVMNASNHAAISAERYGAVQYEERLSESVSLMINYVDTLKQQRDAARRYLQYTKKVLQDSQKETSNVKVRPAPPLNGKSMTKRRASIATICEPRDFTQKAAGETKKITRRTSDFSLKTTTSARMSRPSRLELGVDLVKIKEGSVDENVVDETRKEEETIREEIKETSEPAPPQIQEQQEPLDNVNSSLSVKLLNRFRKIHRKIDVRYKEWIEDNTLHEFFYMNALLCFSLGFIIISNIFIELKCSKESATSSSRSTFCLLNSENVLTNIYNSLTA